MPLVEGGGVSPTKKRNPTLWDYLTGKAGPIGPNGGIGSNAAPVVKRPPTPSKPVPSVNDILQSVSRPGVKPTSSTSGKANSSNPRGTVEPARTYKGPRSATVHGTKVLINDRGIISTKGPYYGKYLTQANAMPGPSKPSTNSPSRPSTPSPAGGSLSPAPSGGVSSVGSSGSSGSSSSSGGSGGGGSAAARPVGKQTIVNGQAFTVNDKGIINTPGPFYGKYPAEVQRNYQKEAESSVGAELTPLINELNRAMQEQAARSGKSITDLETRGTREYANLGELYGRLGNFQGALQGQQKQNLAAVKGNMGTAYEQLASQLDSTYDEHQGRAADEAARMGLTGMATNSMQGSERDQQYLTQLAGVNKAAAMGGIDQQQAGFDGLMSMMQQSTGAESANMQARSMRETNTGIRDMQFELEQVMRDLGGRRLDVEATRGQQVQELMRALQDQEYARNMEQEQMRFQNDLATKQFGLEERSFDYQQNAAAQQSMTPPSQKDLLETAMLQEQLRQLMAPRGLNGKPNPGYGKGGNLTPEEIVGATGFY